MKEISSKPLVRRAFEKTRGNRKLAARKMNISYKALLNKLKRWSGQEPAAISADEQRRGQRLREFRPNSVAGRNAMIRFQVGDEVQVGGLPTSEWRELRGIVVKVLDRPNDETGQTVQECAVQFAATGRWFLADHLIRTIPDKWIRFFRTEAFDRWKQFENTDLPLLKGDRDTLTALLQDRYGFARRKAEIEADDFILALQERT